MRTAWGREWTPDGWYFGNEFGCGFWLWTRCVVQYERNVWSAQNKNHWLALQIGSHLWRFGWAPGRIAHCVEIMTPGRRFRFRVGKPCA